jgi:hypothetical protein
MIGKTKIIIRTEQENRTTIQTGMGLLGAVDRAQKTQLAIIGKQTELGFKFNRQ